jgi:hypothetical protein
MNFSHLCITNHKGLSLFRLVLFILFFATLFSPPRCYCQGSTSAFDSAQGPIDPYRIGVQCGGSFKIVLGSGNQWAPYTAAGIAVDFPTYLERLYFRMALDGGMLKPISERAIPSRYQRAYIVQSDLTLVYDIYFSSQDVTLRPRVGIANTMLYFSGNTTIRDFDFTASTENEFGPLIGAEAVIHIGKFTIALPVSFCSILSAARRSIIFSTSLYLGGVF